MYDGEVRWRGSDKESDHQPFESLSFDLTSIYLFVGFNVPKNMIKKHIVRKNINNNNKNNNIENNNSNNNSTNNNNSMDGSTFRDELMSHALNT